MAQNKTSPANSNSSNSNSNTNSSTTSKPKQIDFAVGGQAVIEGVMMRSPDFVTVAVRKIDGSILVQDRKYISAIRRWKLTKIPILRGVINMFEMMIIGTKALNFSAQEQMEDEEQFELSRKKAKQEGSELPKREFHKTISSPSSVQSAHKQPPSNKTKLSQIFEALLFAGSIIFALALSIFLFKFVPFWTTTLLSSNVATINDNYILFNLIDGALKVIIFIAYIGFISLLPGISRVFEYHGAEHKAIFNYEANIPLTVENSRKQSRFHPRCGTSFILIVFIISILVYTLFPKAESFWSGFGQRVLILPLIAGLSYEFLKFTAKKQDSRLIHLMTVPGLWLQKLTTREPDDTQLEVAITSLQKALELEQSK